MNDFGKALLGFLFVTLLLFIAGLAAAAPARADNGGARVIGVCQEQGQWYKYERDRQTGNILYRGWVSPDEAKTWPEDSGCASVLPPRDDEFITVLWVFDAKTEGIWPQTYVASTKTPTPNLNVFNDRLTGKCVGLQVDVYRHTSDVERALVADLIVKGLTYAGADNAALIPGGTDVAYKVYENRDCSAPEPESTTPPTEEPTSPPTPSPEPSTPTPTPTMPPNETPGTPSTPSPSPSATTPVTSGSSTSTTPSVTTTGSVSTPSTPAQTQAPALAATGSDLGLAYMALVLLGFGSLALWATRRRKEEEDVD